MGFHRRGDEESSVQEDSCGKTILAHGSAHPCANWRSKSNASWTRMTQREKDDELHRARVHMQFVCRMYKLQHGEGRYLHELCQSELPWRKDCVEEIQEMTGAKLMSVRRRNFNLPSNEKPTVMVTNCPAIAFALRVSAKTRLLNKRYSEHLERNMSTRASKTCMRICLAEYGCSTSGADSTSTFWPVWT